MVKIIKVSKTFLMLVYSLQNWRLWKITWLFKFNQSYMNNPSNNMIWVFQKQFWIFECLVTVQSDNNLVLALGTV